MVIAHIGSGASVTAVHHDRSVDTTTRMTPLEGAVMATRRGDLDPAAVLARVDRGRYDRS
jgi:acetate kinase